ncbi:coniferyl aldehyde dehydrogenase [Vogesella sp. DC21W]|uniref:Aldehyde dehydrogenase n=1 Tax=Vogesella aquatica TaxID=2984206 RepID=A0ABT5J1H0_9NEIS|nr:coniferyl aldehyde dehydrogenase [Vogesella aquatica]MDC7718674.1 coniferyl aldehyde dehydrogenase [Vogesella aquatica]
MIDTLQRQRAAFLRDGTPDLARRRQHLATLRTAVLAYRTEVAAAISVDFGNRSRHETAIMELTGAIQSIDYLSRRLRRFMQPQRRHVSIFYRAGSAHVEYQPKGVIGIMAPWNYPLALTIIPLATALAAGNRAMIKPSELTPHTSDTIQRLLADCFEPDEVAVIQGGAEAGAAFSGLPFDHLLFTGSTAVGRKVMQAASEHLVPLTLELGGKSPAVIARGHVNRQNISSLVYGKLSNAGQTCVAPDYALVHESDLDNLISLYTSTVADFYPAGPTSVDYTSIISQRHFDRLTSLVEDAQRQGARVITAGVAPESAVLRARSFAPMLLVNVDEQMAVMQEEIFGPILPVRTYRTMGDVIGYINAGPRPLALYYFGTQDADCRALLDRTTSGNVGINNTLMHVAQDDLPFGGIGPSGMGAYHGIEGFRAMSHAKGVYVQGRWSFPRLLHAPFGKLAELAIRVTLGPAENR